MALINHQVISTSSGFVVTVVENDVTHKWVTVHVDNSTGSQVKVDIIFNGQSITFTCPINVNQDFTLPNNGIALIQVTNFKGEVAWVPSADFSITANII